MKELWLHYTFFSMYLKKIYIQSFSLSGIRNPRDFPLSQALIVAFVSQNSKNLGEFFYMKSIYCPDKLITVYWLTIYFLCFRCVMIVDTWSHKMSWIKQSTSLLNNSVIDQGTKDLFLCFLSNCLQSADMGDRTVQWISSLFITHQFCIMCYVLTYFGNKEA